MLYVGAWETVIIVVVLGLVVLGPVAAAYVLALVRRWRERARGRKPGA